MKFVSFCRLTALKPKYALQTMHECAIYTKPYPINSQTPTYPYNGTIGGFVATVQAVRANAGLTTTSNTILRCLEEWAPEFKIESVRGVVIERLGKDIVFIRNAGAGDGAGADGVDDREILLFSSNAVMKTAHIQEIYQDLEKHLA